MTRKKSEFNKINARGCRRTMTRLILSKFMCFFPLSFSVSRHKKCSTSLYCCLLISNISNPSTYSRMRFLKFTHNIKTLFFEIKIVVCTYTKRQRLSTMKVDVKQLTFASKISSFRPFFHITFSSQSRMGRISLLVKTVDFELFSSFSIAVCHTTNTNFYNIEKKTNFYSGFFT